MEVPGVCAICGAHGLVKTCVLCGQSVCRQHHDPASNACMTCVRRTGQKHPTQPPADRPEPPEDAGGRFT